jgi:hypothetical protein
METVEAHSHSFPPDAWPFADPINTAAFTSAQVLDGLPILRVFHDHDGDWQFLGGVDGEEGRIICLGCAYERDGAIASLADLPVGWMAYRESPGEAWHREPYEDREV